jgi:hypothetical protein
MALWNPVLKDSPDQRGDTYCPSKRQCLLTQNRALTWRASAGKVNRRYLPLDQLRSLTRIYPVSTEYHQ